MKKKLFGALMLSVFLTIACKKELLKNGAEPLQKISFSKAAITDHLRDSVQAVVDRYVKLGIPGIHVVVKRDNGVFTSDAGYASIEQQMPINPDETDWIFSITKTFTATLIMKEVEKGKIDLNEKIKKYLFEKDAKYIIGSDKITVRMLLNHTSGIIDFTALPEFINAQFEHPLQQPSLQEKMQLVYGKPLNFQPGTDFSYSNTNYLILTSILQNVTGKSYDWLLQQEIVKPLQLTNTFYDVNKDRLKHLQFPNYYFDPNSTGDLVNATDWNIALGNTSLGYGGIAAKATDVLKFYEALINGEVVSKKSFKEMTTWIQGKESYQPDYGLGIEYFQFAPGTTRQFGHEGDGIGCTTQIMYVPDTHIYLYINCTVGRKIPGPFLFKTTDFKNELSALVAKWR